MLKHRGSFLMAANWLMAVSLLIFCVTTNVSRAQASQQPSSVPADMLYTQPGQLVSVNGFRLNLYCLGSGSPSVIFDSGWEDWAPSWSKVQPAVRLRTCT